MTDSLKEALDFAAEGDENSIKRLARVLLREGYVDFAEPWGKTCLSMWDYPHLALIVLGPGPYWSNQVGGTACFHPRAQGIYIPLPANYDVGQTDPLYDYYCLPYDKELVDEFLRSLHPNEFREIFKIIPEDRYDEARQLLGYRPTSKLELNEAWVPLVLDFSETEHGNEYDFLNRNLKQFDGRIVILTYENSD